MSDVELPFHRLDPYKFEELAATVLQHHFNIPVLTFTKGRDRGRDGAIRNVSIKVGDQEYHKQNIVVQVKHTKREGMRINNSIRKQLFQRELNKVHELVKRHQLTMYIIVMNYRTPAGQEEKIVSMFGKVQCERVIVIGCETLSRWIKESKELTKRIADLYHIGGYSSRKIATHAAKGVQRLERAVRGVAGSIEEVQQNQTVVCDGLGEQTELMTDVSSKVDAIHEEIKKTSLGLQRSLSSLESQLTTMPSLQNNLTYCQKRQEPEKKPADQGTTVLPSALSPDLLQRLVSQVGLLKDWKFVARYLGLQEADIMCIQSEHADLREQVYRMLKRWQSQHTGGSSVAEDLRQALINCRLNAVAKLLEKS